MTNPSHLSSYEKETVDIPGIINKNSRHIGKAISGHSFHTGSKDIQQSRNQGRPQHQG